MTIEIKALYSVAEVAEMMGAEARAVRRMVDAGHLDCERIGDKVFIPLSTLQARPAIWDSILLREAHRGTA